MNSNKYSNHHFAYSILIDNTKEKVWDFLTDVKRWKDWDTELLDAELTGEFKNGATGILTPKKGPKLPFIIRDIVPHKSYSLITKMPIGSLHIQRTLLTKGKAIEFVDDIQFRGIFKRVFGIILGRGFRAVLPEVMENFKKLAEKE